MAAEGREDARAAEGAENARAAESTEGARAAEGAEGARAAEGAEGAERMAVRCALAVMAIVVTAACSGPLQLANIQVGRSLNQDGSVASITTLFKPSETIYVSVQTGAGKGVIGVKWKFGEKVVAEPTKSVDYNTGPKSTEFHLQNSGGFPPGDYSVDVFIDGVQVGTRAFKVD